MRTTTGIICSIAAAAALTAMTMGTTVPAFAEDACAGQTWPNLSEACIDQRTKQLSDIVNKKKPASQQARADGIKTNN